MLPAVLLSSSRRSNAFGTVFNISTDGAFKFPTSTLTPISTTSASTVTTTPTTTISTTSDYCALLGCYGRSIYLRGPFPDPCLRCIGRMRPVWNEYIT
uniref:Uncharacterized protein n=1 Tax=Panagrellus redivivus TaxID=6233 RepID=A0A7E4VC94_PANRE